MEALDENEEEEPFEDLDAQNVNLAQIRKKAGLPELVADALPSSQASKYMNLELAFGFCHVSFNSNGPLGVSIKP